ncbi:hypothetical protein PAXINDRAFT_83464 [Paxillus involutus ATCC 200175]|uniref:Uncharacterized protein n=1 Tax=Paxillus involutus ATCC 200175 TaxID=664439 RepID=A0A0C9TXP4_PAXIN|nr:hypothetical protein PAXINDRAFT_83464 [Paxillus involutus ATCC 200175]
MNTLISWIPGPLRLSEVQLSNLNVVQWPSLYNPVIEVDRDGFGLATQPGGSYLQQPDDIFRFTLYWSLIFHIPFNFIAGTYAFFNFLFPPARPTNDFPLLSPPLTRVETSASPQEWPKPPRVNARRSRLTFALLVLLTFLSLSLVSAVVGAAVVGFVLAGVYKAGGFYMSTWIPFIWAVIQGLVALLGIWPSIIDII